MDWTAPRLLLALLLAAGCRAPAAESKEITHEDIKDAMLSLVHLMRDNTDKLERHEARDRQTDEQLKKAVGLLAKRAAGADALKAHLAKLEERLGGVEQLLAQREERERAQAQRTADALEDLESRLEGWATEVESRLAPGLLARLGAAEAELGRRLAEGAAATGELRREVQGLGAQLTGALARPGPTTQAPGPGPLEDALQQLRELPRAAELRELHNQSRAALERTGERLAEAVGQASGAVQAGVAEGRLEAQRELAELRSEMSRLAKGLGGELRELTKAQALVPEMADHVLDTKKRLEHACKILREVGELVLAQGLDINGTLNARFDGLSSDILDSQNGALANLTLKMEQEMNQVWRQINVMYQQMMESAKALDKLHRQNEAYANGTTETMDGMESKVGEITKRMNQVDTNLNYLLGRLSLVTHEFNQIKDGLGAALDSIKASFREVQRKANDLSPGPHPLPRDYDQSDPTADPPLNVADLPSSRR